VLDPSYGGCAVLRVALEELAALGATRPTALVYGADIDAATAQWAGHLVSQGVPRHHLQPVDFLSLTPDVDLPLVSAVAGNPPYVRHHRLSGEAQAQAVKAAEAAGLRLSGRSSLWAYFVVHAARFVEPGGRMAFLLPGAVVQADYAGAVLEHLERRFDDVLLVRVRERIFDDAEEETVVLLASGRGAAGQARPRRFRDVDDLAELEHLLEAGVPDAAQDTVSLDGVASWKDAAVSAACRAVLERVLGHESVTTLGAVARVGLGTVTGANAVFVLTEDETDRLGVRRYTRPVVGRSAWLEGPVVTAASLRHAGAGRPGRLLSLPPDYPLDRRTRLGRHLRAAEADGVDARRHCQRDPWWALGDVTIPDAFLPYTVARPRGLALNAARAASTNTVHQVTWRGQPAEQEQRSWVLSSWSSLGRLCAELYGRHYGGGVLKLELAAAQRLPLVAGLAISDAEWTTCRHDRVRAEQTADRVLLTSKLVRTRGDLQVLDETAARLAAERVGGRAAGKQAAARPSRQVG
jgi:adenine-specific DNA-methyltransferase